MLSFNAFRQLKPEHEVIAYGVYVGKIKYDHKAILGFQALHNSIQLCNGNNVKIGRLLLMILKNKAPFFKSELLTYINYCCRVCSNYVMT